MREILNIMRDQGLVAPVVNVLRQSEITSPTTNRREGDLLIESNIVVKLLAVQLVGMGLLGTIQRRKYTHTTFADGSTRTESQTASRQEFVMQLGIDAGLAATLLTVAAQFQAAEYKEEVKAFAPDGRVKEHHAVVTKTYEKRSDKPVTLFRFHDLVERDEVDVDDDAEVEIMTL